MKKSIFLILYLILISIYPIFSKQPNQIEKNNYQAKEYSDSILNKSKILNKINFERRADGLKPLSENDELDKAALEKAEHMFQNQYWDHISPDGVEPWYFIKKNGYFYRIAGENLAKNFSNTESVVKSWMNSPLHKKNIMHPKYEDTGIAIASGKMEGEDTIIIVQMFGVK